MSGRKRGKNLTLSLLKRRGWTMELIKALLPEPYHVPTKGATMRVWAKKDVLAAELTPQFAAGRAEGREPPPRLSAACANSAREALCQAWKHEKKDKSPAWRLAGYYHAAITSRIVSAGKKNGGLSTSQATPRLKEFLALEHRCVSAQVPEILKNFIRAAPWLGDDLEHPLSVQVRERYPLVLLAVAGQVIADFTTAQPESELDGLLAAKGFPTKLLLAEGLGGVWSVWYVPQAIRTSLSLLIALNPKDEYPETRAMHRHFTLHLGGTNTGKTYAGFQRLRQVPSGVYLAPLRLLALEAQETLLKAGVEAVIPPLEYAVVGFSDLILQADFDLLEVLTEWNRMPTAEPYQKLDISRYITLISKLREMGFTLTREQELRAANIPFDETVDALRDLFFQFLRRWQMNEPIEQPGLPEGDSTLPELELYYKKLDLYFSFAKAFDCPVDEDRLYDSREQVAEDINEILLHRLRNNIRFCEWCGKALPLYHHGRLCEACFQRKRKRAAKRAGQSPVR